MIHFFARDAGAANVLATLHAACPGEKTFWAKDYARRVVSGQGIGYRDFNTEAADRPLGPDDGPLVSAWLKSLGRVSAMVTGVTHWDDMTDRLIWETCAGEGVPTVCFLDGWIRPLERFRVRGEVYRPDCVVANDKVLGRLLTERGLARDRVAVLAHPHLGRVFVQRKEIRSRRRRIRARVADLLGSPFRELIVLASEPQSFLASAGALFSTREFNEVETYRLVKGALDRIESRGKLLAVKLHPKEDGGSWEGVGARLIRKEMSGLDLAAAADVVIGVKSMLLIEAVILGGRVICLEKYTKPWERLVTNDLGLSHPVGDEAELARMLDDLEKLAKPSEEEIVRGFGLTQDYLQGPLDLIMEYAERRAA